MLRDWFPWVFFAFFFFIVFPLDFDFETSELSVRSEDALLVYLSTLLLESLIIIIIIITNFIIMITLLVMIRF